MTNSRLLFLLVLFTVFCCLEAVRENNPVRKTKFTIQREPPKPLTKQATQTSQKKLSIVGGIAASNGDFPSVVYLQAISKTLSEEWQCTGVLIYLNYVITSAWCVIDGEEFTILIGENDLEAETPATRSKSRIGIQARQWTFHVNFVTDSPYLNNIGLIQLPLNVVLGANVSVISMNPFNVSTVYPGVTAKVAGWGSIDPVDDVYPSNLVTTNLKIISSAECQKTWSSVNASFICAASPTTTIGQGLCYQDDGAPLIYANTLLGIASDYGNGCDPTVPGVFTPVAPYIKWINQKVTDAALGKFWTVPSIAT